MTPRLRRWIDVFLDAGVSLLPIWLILFVLGWVGIAALAHRF